MESVVGGSMIKIFILALILNAHGYAANPADVEGTWWLPRKDAKIKIQEENGRLEGFIVQRPSHAPKGEIDKKNPNPELRDRPILGMKVLWGLNEDDEREWTGGRAYDPDSGKTFRAKAELL